MRNEIFTEAVRNFRIANATEAEGEHRGRKTYDAGVAVSEIRCFRMQGERLCKLIADDAGEWDVNSLIRLAQKRANRNGFNDSDDLLALSFGLDPNVICPGRRD